MSRTERIDITSLPIFLRDPAKGEQIAVALDEAAKTLIDELGVNSGVSPVIDAAIRAQADVYAAAATSVRRFIARPQDASPTETGGA